ncbi:hypothetical protein ACJD0Z_01040 [Flavobacteriaceae bacterium M23B6Z8]
MKKTKLKKLDLNKRAISKLKSDCIQGGTLTQPTNVLECWETVFVTKCNGRLYCELFDPDVN